LWDIQKCNILNEIEIIAIDDGSTDGTASVINSLNSPLIKYYYQINKGLSGARNYGISLASNEYIWCIDGDDYIEEGSLCQIYNYLEEYNPDILFVELSMIAMGKRTKQAICVQPLTKKCPMSGKDAILNGYFPTSVSSAIIKRDFIEKNQLQFYPRLYHEDVEFMYRAVALAQKVIFTSLRPYIYELRPNSISTSNRIEDIVKRYADNAIIANSFINFSKNIYDVKLKTKIAMHAKSIVIGTIYSLRKERDKDIVSKSLKQFSKLGLFPIRSPFRNIKQRIFSYYLNTRFYHYM